ncbi:MAG TPA: DUF6502 family protein [Steroidobacteraceae bacterium]|jgi:hypothetical protein|nr:DUF6502 family protein [Steroidobacteraceae bacterium]
MSKTSREKEAVLSVFAALVQPLMRVAFEYGISAGEIAGVVRRVYIQALEARLRDQKRPTTDARIAAVAGIAKSDVSALREASRMGAPHSLRAAVGLDQVASLLSAWHTQAGFSGAYGLALELDLAPTPSSPRKSFRELVALACPGADEEALLDELVAAGSVEVLEGTTIRCLSRALVTQETDARRIERTGRFLAVVADNFVHNLLRSASDPLYFERAVVSDELVTEAGRDKFLAIARERGQELLVELDAYLSRLVPTERSEAGKKYGVGIYFFEDKAGSITEAVEQAVVQQRGDRVKPAVQEIDVLAGLGHHK